MFDPVGSSRLARLDQFGKSELASGRMKAGGVCRALIGCAIIGCAPIGCGCIHPIVPISSSRR
jgi:hypothetical protein